MSEVDILIILLSVAIILTNIRIMFSNERIEKLEKSKPTASSKGVK